MTKLQIIKFSPEDYSIGSILHSKNKSVLEAKDKIGSAISLYLQWPEYSKAYIRLEDNKDAIQCEISVDSELKFPDELFIKISTGVKKKLLDIVTIRFETFRTCFEFTTNVIGCEADGTLITSIPTRIVTFKSRRLPRIDINNRNVQLCNSDSKFFTLKEIGANSLVVQIDDRDGLKIKNIVIDGVKFNLKHVRTYKNKSTYQVQFRNKTEYNIYFSFYAKYAYPSLEERSPEHYDDAIDLLVKSGYLDTFKNKNKKEDFFEELTKTWSFLDNSKEIVSKDFISYQNGRPIGMSSLTKSFLDIDGIPIWTMHQLCSEKNPSLLQNSGELYLWRAEFIAAFPQRVDAVVWFRSQSRWLERLYVKYARAKDTEGIVQAIKMRKFDFHQRDFKNNKKAGIKKVTNDTGRDCYNKDSIIAAVNPRYLNCSELLNQVYTTNPYEKSDHLLEVAKIASELSNTPNIRISFPWESKIEEGEPRPSDRKCSIPQNDNLELLNAIEHSIAVTKRKFDV